MTLLLTEEFKNIVLRQERITKLSLFTKAGLGSEHDPIRREVLMFRSVLDMALIDLLTGSNRRKAKTLEWLDLKNEDFKEVCELALLDPVTVFETFFEVKRIRESHSVST